MSIRVENNLKDSDKAELLEQRVHYMPCNIEEDGPANVKKYFEPYVNEDTNGVLSASFRGRPLDGAQLALPAGYRALVVTEAKRPLDEHAPRKLQVAGGFKELIYWNWDKKPSKNDNFARAMDWIDIADAIHGD